jgi:hypothetical protein
MTSLRTALDDAALVELELSLGDPIILSHTENGPELWAELLEQLPNGIIAGGAVRDWFLGVPPKDIDIFFGASDFPHVGAQFQQVVGDKWDANSERAEEYEAMSDIGIVLRGEIEGLQIDLVGLNVPVCDPSELLALFDFGITRCAFAPEWLIDSAEAEQDRLNKTVTLLLDDRPERAQVRFDRFNERMGGGWTFVKP